MFGHFLAESSTHEGFRSRAHLRQLQRHFRRVFSCERRRKSRFLLWSRAKTITKKIFAFQLLRGWYWICWKSFFFVVARKSIWQTAFIRCVFGVLMIGVRWDLGRRINRLLNRRIYEKTDENGQFSTNLTIIEGVPNAMPFAISFFCGVPQVMASRIVSRAGARAKFCFW